MGCDGLFNHEKSTTIIHKRNIIAILSTFISIIH